MVKRKKKNHFRKSVIVISTIVLLNLLGVSYASWSDTLVINTRLSTGKLDINFNTGGKTKIIEHKKKATEDREVIYVIKDLIQDDSTVPIEFKKFNIDNDDIHIMNDNGTLRINTKKAEPGIYDYKIDLLFEQKIN